MVLYPAFESKAPMTGQFNLYILEQSTLCLRLPLPHLALTVLALLGTSACSGDNSTLIANEPTSQGAAGAVGSRVTSSSGPQDNTDSQNVDTNNEGPLYVVNTTIDSPDGRTAYFLATASIEGDVELNVRDGLEIPGNARAYGLPGVKNAFLASGGDSATFTRYDVQDDGSFVEGDTMSFANLGVSNLNRQMLFVGNEKAYYFDSSQLQIIRFNPQSLEVNQAIAVEELPCEGNGDTYFGQAIRRDDGIYLPLACYSDSGFTQSGTSLLHLDPSTDEVTVTQDSRCTGLSVGFMAENGNAYWFSGSDASVYWALQQRDIPHDCALRLQAGQATFDQEWELDLTSRTGGVAAIASLPAAGSSMWMKVFDESAMTESIPVDEVDWGLEVWRWALLDVESDAMIEPFPDEDPVVYYGGAILLDGRSFTPASNADYTETTLLELTASGVEKRLHIQGELRKIVKLR